MSNVDHVNITCYRSDCHAVITLHRQDYDRLRESHDSFYCPVGHGQAFQGKTDKEKRIEELERVIRRNGRRMEEMLTIREELVGSLKSCPFGDGCGYRSRRYASNGSEWSYSQMVERVRADMAEHLELEHGAVVRHPVATADPEGS